MTIRADLVEQLQLALTSINVGYRGFGKGGGNRSGSCNVDVICPEGDDWRLDIPSVGVISTGGSTFCTGFMVNNTANDLTPYFMTAEHCGIHSGNAASLVVYWNYENSWCRPPGSPESGQPGDGSLDQFQTGSFWRSSYDPSDVTLVELDEDPDPLWEVSYAGWDRTSNDASMAVAIHHPNTDEKRISFEYQPTTTTSYLGETIPGDGTHVRVEDWDLGTTEPGSSGSPLFNQDHRAVGQLHGGYASCTSQTSDWYGRFSVSWTGGGTPSTRLSDWLDSESTGDLFTDTISLATLCSDAGEIALDRAALPCEGIADIEVVDCGLNTDDEAIETVTVTIDSDSEPAGESVVLTETQPDSAKFEGFIPLGTTNSAGVLLVAEGDTVTATYIDADDGEGGTNIVVTATAIVDCTPPVISNVQVLGVQPRSATISFDADEPVLGSVLYGESCWPLPGKESASGYDTSVVVEVTGLDDNTTYYFAADGEDQAGNATTDDNGGSCYTFTTPEVPDFFTEQFGGDNDLDNLTLSFVPNGSPD
ncbi:MAG: trypsin-like serine peptidase, partial [Planctomycetota bacterium]